MKTILSGKIDHLIFENGEMIHNTRVICDMRSTVIQLIHTHIELGYSAMHSMDHPLCYGSFFIFKIKMNILNRSKLFPYENPVEDQIIYFLEFFTIFVDS
jgi:hypothetical protein